MFEAVVFAVFFLGFRPRCALEFDDAGESRIEKICRLIASCRYGVHDISRTELDEQNRLPRFNMPFELGLFLGARRFGNTDHRRKRCVVLDIDQYRFQRFLSDIAGSDIRHHGGDIDTCLRAIRDWLASASRRHLPGQVRLIESYSKFRNEMPELASAAGLDPADVSYADYERLVVGWLTPID